MIRVVYREEVDRWLRGDRYVRPLVRRIVRGRPRRRSGMQKVVDNFLLGLARLGMEYSFNRTLLLPKSSEKTISFGLGMLGLEGLTTAAPVIAAIGFPHPLELPALCETFNIRKFLQHSQWVLDLVKSAGLYREDVFELWSAGIDTEDWRPRSAQADKEVDVLIYNKIRWDKDRVEMQLAQPIRDFLAARGYSYAEIAYGNYYPEDYKAELSRARTMIFLSAHESQGIAYQECLSSGVPVMAWDQGQWLDPIRFKYGRPSVPATSVPFFDERCGTRFGDSGEFASRFEQFFDDAMCGRFSPREYVLENLTIEKSTRRLLEIYRSA